MFEQLLTIEARKQIGTYELLTPGPTGVYGGSVVKHAGLIYHLGGSKLTGELQSNFARYNPSNDSWFDMPPSPRPILSPATVVLGDVLYVLGGITSGTTATADVYTFNFITNTWQKLSTNMPFAAARHRAFVWDNRIFVFNPTSICYYMSDVSTGAWTVFSNGFTNRTETAVTVLGDSFFLLSGRAGATTYIKDFYKYDLRLNAWQIQANTLPAGRHNARLVTVGNKIYLRGGSDSTKQFNDLWVWTVSTGWKNLPSGGQAAKEIDIVDLGGYIYIAGGVSNSNTLIDSWYRVKI